MPNDARRGMQLRGTMSEASIAEEDQMAMGASGGGGGGTIEADQQSVPDVSISEATTIAPASRGPPPPAPPPTPQSHASQSSSTLHRIPSAPNELSNHVSSLPRSSSRPSSAAATAGQGTASLLQIPDPRYGASRRPSSGHQTRSNTIIDFLQSFDEEMEVIRGCGQLSSVLGLMKSFSTTDICNMMTSSYYHDKESDTLDRLTCPDSSTLRPTVSDLMLTGYNQWNPRFDLPSIRRLDCASRSLSLWVTIGDPVPPTLSSQLPSPQAHSIVGSTGLASGQSFVPETPTVPSAVDFVRSMNKKVRQEYIRRRLLSTYRALERLSKSQMNLSAIHSQIQKQTTHGPGLILMTPMTPQTPFPSLDAGGESPSEPAASTDPTTAGLTSNAATDSAAVVISGVLGPEAASNLGAKRAPVTIKDIERDKGKPLTKYERNIMIFDWLQNLDINDFEQVVPN